jgi:HK97 family phage major capsid protein
MSNKFEQFITSAQFDKQALRQGMREVALQVDPNMLSALEARGYRWFDVLNGKVKSNSFEAECSREIAKSAECFQASSEASIFVPFESFASAGSGSRSGSLFSKRDTTDYVGTPSAGGNLVEKEIPDSSPIDPLRPTSALLSEATVIMSRKNNLLIPRISGLPFPLAGSGETVNTQVTQGFSTEQVALLALNYSTELTISNQILAQSGDREIERYVVGLLAKNIGQQLDLLSLYGSGSGQMLGILNFASNPSNTPIGQYDPALACPEWTYTQSTAHASLQQGIRYLDNGNYNEDDREARVWLISGATRQNWAQTLLSSNNSFYLYDHETSRVLHYRAKVTNQLSGTNQAVLIDMREPVYMFVGGGVEVMVNPFTLAVSGQSIITVNYFCAFSCFRGGLSASSNATNNNF